MMSLILFAISLILFVVTLVLVVRLQERFKEFSREYFELRELLNDFSMPTVISTSAIETTEPEDIREIANFQAEKRLGDTN